MVLKLKDGCGGGFVENRESFKENKEKYDK